MRCTKLKSPQASEPDITTRHTHTAIALAAGFVSSLICTPLVAAEFLSPLPVQELEVGQPYTLGIRPSRAPARSSLDAKLSLFVEGLSPSAAFHRTGDELWEFTWLPAEADTGVHVIQILVTERDTPGNVIEIETMTLIVNEAPVRPNVDAGITPTPSQIEVAPMVSSELSDATILVEAVSTRADRAAIETTGALPDVVPAPLPDAAQEFQVKQEPEAEWSLAPIASQIVTPHQWVRFPVQLLSESVTIDEQVALQVDQLPNGASFEQRTAGGRQFEWRPSTADQGEHMFEFTAIDTENEQRRESITMRIIVQE